MTNEEPVAKVAELLKEFKICMLTTVDGDGHLVSRPMAVQEVEFDGDLWFFTDEKSHKVEETSEDSRVNVSFSSRDSWVSVSGKIETVRDEGKTKELWSKSLEAWFPDGPETLGILLLKVEAHTAEYWDSPGSTVTTALSFVKAKVTGERLESENETVKLSD